MKEQFISKRFNTRTLKTIATADAIVSEYQKQGFVLTLRQLYYQFVARGLIENKQSEYKRLANIVSEARLAGLIDWAGLDDITRKLKDFETFLNPTDAIEERAANYLENLHADQPTIPEVWIEKDALVGVIGPVCSRWRLPHFGCRGYASQSAQYEAGKRFARRLRNGQRTMILHLGDHDPSGIDMTRDNEERISLFSRFGVEVRRLALNMEQVEEFDPPPNPAKEADSRFAAYVERFGESSWELDALNPETIDGIIDAAVQDVIDVEAFRESESREAHNRDTMQEIAGNWSSLDRVMASGRLDDFVAMLDEDE
jgi:hypothetical protein